MIKNKILILISSSGCGKSYVLDYLSKIYNYKGLVSHTTRIKRPKEVNHIDYHFVTEDIFLQMIYNEELIEYRTYNTLVNNIHEIWYYGLSKNAIKELNFNTKYVTIFDVQGAKEFVEYYGRDNCFICILKCDDKIREERAKLRGGFDKFEWDRRLEDDKIIFSDENVNNLVDYIIENNGTIEELQLKVKELVNTIGD